MQQPRPCLLRTGQPLATTDTTLTDREVQRLWEQSVYPIGNGRLGATLFGDPRRERIQFNVDSFWVGNEDNTGAYQPFGDVHVTLEHADVTGYRRELDLDRALHSVCYRSGGVDYRRESFASFPAQVMVFHFSAGRTGSLSGTVALDNGHGIPVLAEGNTLVMTGDTSGVEYWRLQIEDPARRMAGRDYASDQNIVLEAEARVRVLHAGGSLTAEDGRIRFQDCDSVTLLLAAGTNYLADRRRGWRGDHPGKEILARLAAAEARPLQELLDEHLADYQPIFRRLALDVGASPEALSGMTTPERVLAYGERFQQDRAPVDRELEVLLYQYARYLMISSSRDGHGGLPATLQGRWLISKRPSWRCDYHTDINVQMNYWFVDPANLPECFLPLARWIDSIREVRKAETRRVLGVSRGWLMRSENGIFGGSTWHIQKGDSAWLCQNLWDHYAFTQDRDYLGRHAYPVLREISEFWLDHLKEIPDPSGSPGRTVWVAPEGRSPEHGPVGVDGVTYDQALCWDLFTNTIDAAEALGVDPDFREVLRSRRDRLLGPRAGRWGQLQEWMEDIDDPRDDHRHINHLIGVYPGRQIHPATTPGWAAAAKVGLVARRDHGQGHPAWSRVWKACLFARLLDGNAAYDQLAETLATHIHGNLWAVHPPFQIDANFGYAAAVHEMLVQSHLGLPGAVVAPTADAADRSPFVIDLLPALPDAWPKGVVRGLRVRGGYGLDLEWAGGALSQVTLRGVSNPYGECLVRYGTRAAIVPLRRGAERTLCASELLEPRTQ